MIVDFACRDTEVLFETGRSRRWNNILNVATRKLGMLHAAVELRDLRAPPGNMLEGLLLNKAGQHSIRINGQFRICFVWTEAGPTHVEIVDYH